MKVNKNKILTTNEYIDIIRPYLSNIINDHENQGEWKIHLTMAINFLSSKEDSGETRTMRTKSNNVGIIMGSKAKEATEKLFKSFLQRYQDRLQESMTGSAVIFYCVDALYYNLNKISLSTFRSYIDSPKWLKNKSITINPKNNDDKCFQYA